MDYAGAVKAASDEMLKGLTFRDLKRKVGTPERERLLCSGGVSPDENAAWLVDYWCGKDVGGLLKMPLSRHWIMHIEAMLRIADRLNR